MENRISVTEYTLIKAYARAKNTKQIALEDNHDLDFQYYSGLMNGYEMSLFHVYGYDEHDLQEAIVELKFTNENNCYWR